MILTEETRVQGKIVEQESQKLPKGVLCRVTYPVCRVGEKNKNNRMYDSAVWDNVHADAEVKEKLEKRCLFGAAEHPQETQSDLQRTSHIVIESYLDKKDNTVYQTFDLLNTPYGRIVNTLLEADCQVGVSTRAEGELEEVTEGEDKYFRVIPESYRYITTDFTADPSTESPYPTKVERAVVREIQSSLDNATIDEEYSAILLEKFKCKEATKLLESMGEAARFKGTTMKIGDKIKVTDGTHKGKQGTIAKIEEGQIAITMEDGSTISVENASSIQILPVSAQPEPAVTEPEAEVVEPIPSEETPFKPAEEEEKPEKFRGFGREKVEELKLGVDYVSTMKKSLKTAVAAISGKDKDYAAFAKAIEDVADDASDAARAAKKMQRAIDIQAETDAEAAKETDKEPVRKAEDKPAEEPEREVKPKEEEPVAKEEPAEEPAAVEEPELVGAATESKVKEDISRGEALRRRVEKLKKIKKDADKEYQRKLDQLEKELKTFTGGVKKETKESKLKEDVNESKLVFENFDAMVRYFEKEFPKIYSKEQKKSDKKLIETTSITSVARRMRELQIREASVRAERDKALEFIQMGDDRLDTSQKSRQLEATILSRKLTKIQEEKQHEIDILIATVEKRGKELIKSHTFVRDLHTNVKVLENKLIESNITHKKKLEEQIKTLKESHKTEKIKQYICTKLEHLGLHIHENTRALLEKCTSIKQVDMLIVETQSAIKKSALHPEKFKEVGVHTEMDEQTQAISDSVTRVLESLN